MPETTCCVPGCSQ